MDVENQIQRTGLKEKEKAGDSNTSKQLKIKLNKFIKDTKDSEKEYISSLKIANNERLVYIEQSKNCFTNLQNLQESLIKFTKDFFMKYVIYNNQLYKNLLFDNNNRMNVIFQFS